MIVILPAFLLVAITLFFAHLRRQRLLDQYVVIVTKAMDGGSAEVQEHLRPLREYVLTESLRKAILACVLGASLLTISWLKLFAPEAYSFVNALGIVVTAYGLGNFSIWFVIDRPRLR